MKVVSFGKIYRAKDGYELDLHKKDLENRKIEYEVVSRDGNDVPAHADRYVLLTDEDKESYGIGELTLYRANKAPIDQLVQAIKAFWAAHVFGFNEPRRDFMAHPPISRALPSLKSNWRGSAVDKFRKNLIHRWVADAQKRLNTDFLTLPMEDLKQKYLNPRDLQARHAEIEQELVSKFGH